MKENIMSETNNSLIIIEKKLEKLEKGYKKINGFANAYSRLKKSFKDTSCITKLFLVLLPLFFPCVLAFSILLVDLSLYILLLYGGILFILMFICMEDLERFRADVSKKYSEEFNLLVEDLEIKNVDELELIREFFKKKVSLFDRKFEYIEPNLLKNLSSQFFGFFIGIFSSLVIININKNYSRDNIAKIISILMVIGIIILVIRWVYYLYKRFLGESGDKKSIIRLIDALDLFILKQKIAQKK